MFVSLDISLNDPSNTIDIIKIVDFINGNSNYKLLHHYSENFVSFTKIGSEQLFRIHKDGRIYVKKNFTLTQAHQTKDNLLMLFVGLKDILNKFSNLIQWNDFRKEINFSFIGKEADYFFWREYPQVKKIGRSFFSDFEIRTYQSSNDFLSVKVESSNLVIKS